MAAANVKIVKELIRLTRAAGVSLYVHGPHGTGKSSVVRQVAKELGIGCLDYRLATCDVGDLRGLPSKSPDGRTVYFPPADLPSEGSGILLLDEINRCGDRALLQACFQLVLDRKLGLYELPPGWSIVVAGNTGPDYDVMDLDPAFLDRFCHIDFRPSFDDWCCWLSSQYADFGVAMDVSSFCGQDVSYLEKRPDRKGLDFITPSRRAWALACRCLQEWERARIADNGSGAYAEETQFQVLAGLVGMEAAVAFCSHQRCPITPKEVLEQGCKQLANQIRRLDRNSKMSLMWGLFSHARDRADDPHVANVVLDFLDLMRVKHKDLACAFAMSLISELGSCGRGELLSRDEQLALLTNQRLGQAFARVNNRRENPSTFIDFLANRPKLARLISEAMSIQRTAA